ncbi:T9SS type A sorting domain-containing protein [Spirosoma soli]|uniref:T9SS type A sorting domain-containing protein n=1 Tax=Spirosoma soli TaxID=1770529 RepID=A0ABW5LYG2_9BACT
MGIALLTQPSITFARQFLRGFLLVSCCAFGSVAWAQTPLTLPFFDDFSIRSGGLGQNQPDPALWQPGSGVYINNTMAVSQPTVNVASFDGLRANGRPYIQNNQLAQGYTDTLASLPITLEGLSPADSVYLSFYWQIKGLGEVPDPGDSLTLQFLDRTGNWRTVWRVENAGDSLRIQYLSRADTLQARRQVFGSGTVNNFFQAFVPVLNPNFFHAGFAFRFRSYGLESGPFDTWNLDYVYLNRRRTLNDIFIKDVAVRQALSPLLRRYTAMPLAQYVVNPAGETADSVTTEINNLFNTFNSITSGFTIRDEVSDRVIQNISQPNSILIPSLSSQRQSVRLAPVTDLGAAARAVLRYKFEVVTTDNVNPSIPGVDLRRNDTISSVAVLDNYYAYDDGTWEYAQQIRQQEQIAVRFILNKPDAIAGVSACIVPFTTNQSGQPFVINVYSNRNGRPGTAIYRQSFSTQYPASRNGFVNFPFTRSVTVQDTFYVGYQQISSSDTTLLRLGFDKNSLFGSQIFYNGGTIWEQPNSTVLNFQGAFMLRPIMGGKPDTVVTATPEPEPLAPLQAYPNPTTGLIRWDEPRLTRLEVVNLTGRLLYALEPSRGQQTLDLSYLPDGFYLLRLSAGQRTTVQKLIVQH